MFFIKRIVTSKTLFPALCVIKCVVACIKHVPTGKKKEKEGCYSFVC